MTNIMTNIRATETSARNVHGADINILLARAPALGHTDCCVIIQGEKHAAVAFDIARFAKGAKITLQTSPAFMGLPASTHSVVEFPAAN